MVEKKDEVKEPQDGDDQTEEEVEESTEEDESIGKKEEDFFPKTDEEGEEGDTSEDPEEDATSEEDDGAGLADELDLDDFDDSESESEKKSGVQKRIDKLTAEKRSLEERLAKVEESQTTKETPEYSEAQLKTAMSKALEEGDPNLMYEVMEYRISKAQKDAVSKYQKEQQDAVSQQQKQQEEWQSVVEEYSYLSDPNEPELYKGSHKDLNIQANDSLAYKLATKLYLDPERAERYQKGGQRLAISDAIRMILRKKNAKISSKKNKKLERRLAKEKKKSSVSSGKNVKAEKTKPRKKKSNLEEYMEDRKKQKAGIAGGM